MTIQIVKKCIRGKYVKWRNIATFNNEREAKAAKTASRGVNEQASQTDPLV